MGFDEGLNGRGRLGFTVDLSKVQLAAQTEEGSGRMEQWAVISLHSQNKKRNQGDF